MKRGAGTLLLGIWLILYGVTYLGFDFPGRSVIMAVLALIAGILLMIGK